MASQLFEPFKFLTKDVRIILILLNQPLPNNNVLKMLWKNALLKVCCDGAANRLYKFNSHVQKQQALCAEELIPNFICGDLDSIVNETRLYFENKGTQIVHLEDQDNTDFTKSTFFAMDYCKEKKIDYDVIVSYPAIGGRLDQTFSNINTLYHLKGASCYLLSELDVVCLLQSGKSKIEIDLQLYQEWCGLIPIGLQADHVTTTGLKYNLSGQSMCFGDLISTSNSIETGCNEVTVETSHPLVWTIGYRADLVG